MNFKFELEKRQKKKYTCPACGRRRFVRYIDTSTGEYISDEFGRCDREDSCGYWLKPGNDVSQNSVEQKYKAPPRVYIPFEVMKATRINYEQNTFVRFLLTLFDNDTVTHLITRYHLGTSLRGCVFWFIDHLGNIAAGQVKQFDESGHTVKESETWV